MKKMLPPLEDATHTPPRVPLVAHLKNRITQILRQLKKFRNENMYFPSLFYPPLTLNEEILLLKLFSSRKLNIFTDKLAAKEIIRDARNGRQICELRIPETIAVYSGIDSFTNSLPQEKCVVKANHGSGMIYLYDPSRQISQQDLATMKDWLSTDYSVPSGERCYEGITPLLFCEKLLVCSDGRMPIDIKVHCCYGRILMTQIIDRWSGELRRLTFDTHNRSCCIFQNEVLDYDSCELPLEQACSYASLLSSDFSYVRVDFYLVDSLLYFSELTFYPNSAAMPLRSFQVDLRLGKEYRHLKRMANKRVREEIETPVSLLQIVCIGVAYAALAVKTPLCALNRLVAPTRTILSSLKKACQQKQSHA